MERRNRRRPGAFVLATIAAGSLIALGLGAASGLTPTHAAEPPAAPPSVRATATHAPRPATTPVPLPKAGTVGQPGAPKPPLELDVPFVGGAWPVGLFVLDVKEAPSKAPGAKTVTIDLGVLNEASQPLTVGMSVQYKEAISLYSEDRWKGLVFVGLHTAGGRDVLPADGSGADDLPSGVWGQVQVSADIPADDSVSALTAGVGRDHMAGYPLPAATLKVAGQPWAAPGAAATPVSITAAPAPTK